MNCGCNTIYPDVDMTRWQVQCSSYIEDADNYYTKAEVDAKIESGVTPDLSDYYTKEETDSAITSAITAVEAEIPTVPTSNTAFTNDAGYLTEHQSLSAYSTTDEVNSAITEATSGKANTSDIYTYIAGNGINISNAAGIRRKSVAVNLPIYSGIGLSSIAINLAAGSGGNSAGGSCSIAANSATETKNIDETAFGHYNVSNSDGGSDQFRWASGETLFSVGNGCSQASEGRPITKHNAFEIMQNGDIYIADTNETEHEYAFQKPMVKLQDTVSAIGNLKFVSLTQADYDALVTSGTTDTNTIYFIKNS